jgi:ubiquinone/menaquinone biosynthesis C-methylase UbiE
MRQYYDRRAPWHDQYMSYVDNARMEELLRPIVDIVAPIVEGRRVLEVACGTGNWTIALARRAEHVVAVDSSVQSLEIAGRKLAGVDNVTLLEADAYRLDGVDSDFSVVFASDWYSHMPVGSISAFLDAVCRVGGDDLTAVFLDMTCRDALEKEISGYDDDGNCLASRTLPDGTPFTVIKNFPTESQLRAQLRSHFPQVDYYHFAELERYMVVCRGIRH